MAKLTKQEKRINELLTKLYWDPDDAFYAHLFSYIDRRSNEKIEQQSVSINEGNILFEFNEEYMEGLEDRFATFTLKHVAGHLISQHLEVLPPVIKGNEKSEFNGKLAELAMDYALNHQIDDITAYDMGVISSPTFRELLAHMPVGYQVVKGQAWQYYFALED